MHTEHDHDVSSDLSGTYIKKTDVQRAPLVLEILSVDKQTFPARGSKDAESKWVLTFKTSPLRKLSLNKTNLSTLAKAYGTRTAAWIGTTVQIYYEPSVSFGAEITGGIRVRTRQTKPATATPAPQRATRPAPPQPPLEEPPLADYDDSGLDDALQTTTFE